jgi:integrase
MLGLMAGAKPMNGANLYNREWTSLLERADLLHSFTFHMLRHTFAPIKELLAGTQSDQNRRA